MVKGLATGSTADVSHFESRQCKIFLLSTSSRTIMGPPKFVSNGHRGSFPRSKAAGALSSPLTPISCRGKEYVDLYILSPILLRGLVLTWLSRGTNLHFILPFFEGQR
jgi:hypothetical protein